MLNNVTFRLVIASTLVGLLAACQSPSDDLQKIDSERLSETVKTLASDEFYGRAPGGAGEEITVNYLIERFRELGLQPAGDEGSWTQAVPLIHTQVEPSASIKLTVAESELVLVQGENIEFSTTRKVERLVIEDAPVVFVGYGAYAPERQWDDFGDIDLNGKLAVFLVNDPDFAAAADEPVSGLFGDRRMTYYGRWTYKFEEAARRGAIAALVIHEDAAAGYGWSVASSSPGENYSILRPAESIAPPLLQGWLHGDTAAALFAAAGLNLDEQSRLARSPDFQAFTLEAVKLSADVAVSSEIIESQNVLAMLPGSQRPNESIMVSAHWDAYGVGEPDNQGRTIRPGANDDALGVAGVLELARVLSRGEAPQRSVCCMDRRRERPVRF